MLKSPTHSSGHWGGGAVGQIRVGNTPNAHPTHLGSGYINPPPDQAPMCELTWTPPPTSTPFNLGGQPWEKIGPQPLKSIPHNRGTLVKIWLQTMATQNPPHTLARTQGGRGGHSTLIWEGTCTGRENGFP